jgi:hypothetical protein
MRERIAAALYGAAHKWRPKSLAADRDIEKAVTQSLSRFLFFPGHVDVLGWSDKYHGRTVGRTAARRKLNLLARHAAALANEVELLPTPVPGVLGEEMALELIDSLRDLGNATQRCDLQHAPGVIGKGRPQDSFIIAVADVAIRFFERVTGKKATAPLTGQRGPVPLIRDVFAILGIQATAKAAYHAAIEARAKAPRE